MGERTHFGIAELRGDRFHQVVLARAAAERLELGDEIVGLLSGKMRDAGIAADAFAAVAGLAGGHVDLHRRGGGRGRRRRSRTCLICEGLSAQGGGRQNQSSTQCDQANPHAHSPSGGVMDCRATARKRAFMDRIMDGEADFAASPSRGQAGVRQRPVLVRWLTPSAS